MDHHHRIGATAAFDGFTDKYYKGRKPVGFYIPQFVNVDAASKKDYLRGFGYQGGGSRGGWQSLVSELGVGPGLKTALSQPGKWFMGMTGFGECLPDPDNRVTLNTDRLDQDGLPTLNMNVAFGENERAMRPDMKAHAAEMLEAGRRKGRQRVRRDGLPRFQHPRNGIGAHGAGPKDVRPQPPQPGLELPQRLRDGRFGHDERRVRQPQPDLPRPHGPGGGSRRRGVEPAQSLVTTHPGGGGLLPLRPAPFAKTSHRRPRQKKYCSGGSARRPYFRSHISIRTVPKIRARPRVPGQRVRRREGVRKGSPELHLGKLTDGSRPGASSP